MAIVGIESVFFGVEDLELCTRFFKDFGLPLVECDAVQSRFELANGATVNLYHKDDQRLPKAVHENTGVRETIWGVDTLDNMNQLIASLGRDRTIDVDSYGVAHFATDCGIAMGLKVFEKKRVVYAPDAVNSTDNIKRLNQHRRWRTHAEPKCINHVVFNVEDYTKSTEFLRERLGFRITDHSRSLGVFLRADGTNEHHSIFLKRCNVPNPKGKPGFEHVCFGVEDIDEIMAGANHMTRQGWDSPSGLGRHRIGSALFYYINCPAGGQAEYGADTDFLDDNWVPRNWEPLFGNMLWVHNLPPYMKRQSKWDVQYENELVNAPKG